MCFTNKLKELVFLPRPRQYPENIFYISNESYIEKLKKINIGNNLLLPGLRFVAKNYDYNINDKILIEFLEKEHIENKKDYDEKGLPINDNYDLLYKRFNNYLKETFMYQPRRIFKERII